MCYFIYNCPKTAHTMLYYLKDTEKVTVKTKIKDKSKYMIKLSFVNYVTQYNQYRDAYSHAIFDDQLH